MPSILEVRHLEMVAAIADARSVAGAAARLHLSQPALSHALRTLETRVGVRLFERARQMTLTSAGAELCAAAGRILPAIREVEERLHQHASGTTSVVRVATECYTCYHWLPSVLNRLHVVNPRASVRIVGQATPRALDALLNGELDLAVLHFKPSNPRLSVEKLFTDEQLLITRPGHALAGRRFVVPEDFRDQHLLAHREPEQTVFWKTFLEPAGVTPSETTSLHATEAVVESVKAGLGIAVIARWAVANSIAAGEVAAVRVGRHGLRRSWYAATLKGRQDEVTKALMEVLRSDAGKAANRLPARARAVAAQAVTPMRAGVTRR